MKRLLCLLLCLSALFTLCGCEKRAGEVYSVTIWYAPDDPLAQALQTAAEDYNRSRKESALPVTLREFADAAQLTGALNTAQPDLLLCSHTLAFSLYERGLLTEPGNPVAFPDALSARSPAVGRSVFLLGSRVQLLCARETISPDLSALCKRAAAYGMDTRTPFLAADSYTDLICQAVLGSGEFHADRAKDCFNESFRAAWNALAEAAFSGGLCVGEAPAVDLLQGGLPAAVLYADALTGGVPEGCTLSALCPEGAPLLSDLRCLAVLAREGRQQRGTAAFLSWLFSGRRPAQLALESGLIPTMPGAEGADALSAQLLSLRERTLWLPDGACDYVKNRTAFEQEFRAAMALLK